MEIRRRAQIKQADKIIGNRVKVKIVKNKVAAPFRTTEFDIMYNEGISVSGDLIDTGIEYKVVNKSGNSYSFGEERFGVGREKAKAFLREHPKMMKEIRKKIWEAIERGEAPPEEKGKPGKKETVEDTGEPKK